jgi:hypothetical protein
VIPQLDGDVGAEFIRTFRNCFDDQWPNARPVWP